MKRQSTYRLYLGPLNQTEATEYRTAASGPKKALQLLVEMAGLELADQDGRYGTTTDGRRAHALTESWSRAHYADHGTTRV